MMDSTAWIWFPSLLLHARSSSTCRGFWDISGGSRTVSWFPRIVYVLDYRFDSIFVARDAFVFQEPLNICVGETYDSVNVKISESFLSRESLLSTTVQFESAWKMIRLIFSNYLSSVSRRLCISQCAYRGCVAIVTPTCQGQILADCFPLGQ